MIELVLTLALLGFLVYLIINNVPMPDPFKQGIVVLCVILVVLYLVKVFGFDIPLPHR